MGIPIDTKLGINPALTVCPRCGGPANELVLAGNSLKWRCDECGRHHVSYAGQAMRMECPCGNKYRQGKRFTRIAKFDGNVDKAIASQPCEECRKELDEQAKVVAEGGIYWECKDCGASGAIRGNSDYAKHVREKSGIKAPDPVGIEFNKETCPLCTGQVQRPEGGKADGEDSA